MFNPVQTYGESKNARHGVGIHPGWDGSTRFEMDIFFFLLGQKHPSSHHKHKPNHPGTLHPTVYTNTPTHSYTHKMVNRITQLHLSHLTHRACVNPCILYTVKNTWLSLERLMVAIILTIKLALISQTWSNSYEKLQSAHHVRKFGLKSILKLSST